MDAIIEHALEKSKFVKNGAVGKTCVYLKDGMVLYIEYHTDGKMNICDKCKKMTLEKYEWKMAGCTNRQEYREYLNKSFWDNL